MNERNGIWNIAIAIIIITIVSSILIVPSSAKDIEMKYSIVSGITGDFAAFSNAFDSNPSTYTDATPQNAYANMTLYNASRVKSIGVWDYEASGFQYTGTVDISGSHDGVTWTGLATVVCSGTSSTPTTKRFPSSTTNQSSTDNTTFWEYIQIYAHGNTRGAYATIQELEITIEPQDLPPIATFTTNSTGGEEPVVVAFTDTTQSNPSSWEWSLYSLGNASAFPFSYAQNPIHSFEVGNYSVFLNATNNYGYNISTQSTWINVTEKLNPMASFLSNTSTGEVPLSVQFTDTSTGPGVFTYSWNFGDNTSLSTDQNPIHTFSSEGSFTVNQSVTNANGTSYSESVISAFVLEGFNRADLYMEEQFVLTVQYIDSDELTPIPVVYVIDNYGNSAVTTTGLYNETYTYGTTVLYARSDGYIGKTNSFYMDTSRTETVQMTKYDSVSIQQQVYPQYVTFHLKQGWGAPLSDVLVEIQGSDTSTGSWDWVKTLLGLPLDDAPVNVDMMNQTTDTLGRVTFYVVPTAKYTVTFTKSGYTIPPMELVPQDKDYIVWAYSDTGGDGTYYRNGVNELEVVNISVTSYHYNDSYAYLNITYYDSSGHTTGGYIDVLQKNDNPWSAPNLVTRWPITGNSFTNSTGILHQVQVSGYINTNISHSDFGQITRSYPYSFNSVPVQFLGFDKNITLIVSLGMILLTLMLAGATHSRQVVFVSFVEAWIFYAMHWFQALIDRGVPEASIVMALIIGTVMAAAAAFEVRKKKEKY